MDEEKKVHGPHILLKTILETLFFSKIEGVLLVWNFHDLSPPPSESAFVYLLLEQIKMHHKDYRILILINGMNPQLKNSFFQGKQFYKIIEEFISMKNSYYSEIEDSKESILIEWFQTFKKFNFDFILLDYFFLVTKYDSFYFNRNEIKDALKKMKETDLLEEWNFLCSLKDTKFF